VETALLICICTSVHISTKPLSSLENHIPFRQASTGERFYGLGINSMGLTCDNVFDSSMLSLCRHHTKDS